MKRPVQLLLGMLLGLLGLILSSGALVAVAAPPAQAATTWQALIGAESADHGLQVQAFLPAKITVNEGDTINWTMNTDFVHTVTFLSGGERPADLVPAGEDNLLMQNPAVAFPAGGPNYDGAGYVNSGVLMGKGASFSLTFAKAGTYPYLCLLHPGMVGEVIVQPAGSAYPKSQAEMDRQAKIEESAKLAEAEGKANSYQVTSQSNPDGTTNYTVANGVGGNQATVLRFLPGALTIKAGDSVSFPVLDPHEIHSVTFFDPNGPVPPFVQPKEQAGGPPKLLIPHAAPSGGTEVVDQKLYNSGILGPDQSYTFKFPKPGVYNYVCVIHAPQGMFGTIRVAEAGLPSLLPVAGADTLRESPLLLVGSAIVLILLGLLIRWRWAGKQSGM